MTIAACFLTAEGVVLGADSTVTLDGKEPRYFNHAQKLFQVGDSGTLALVMWGDVPVAVSYRAFLATFADEIAKTPPTSVLAASELWARLAWEQLRGAHGKLLEKADSAIKHLGSGEAVPEDEAEAFERCSNFSTGFCLAGYCPADRRVMAYQVDLNMAANQPPTPKELPSGRLNFWGAPNILQRVLHGIDWRVLDGLLEATNGAGEKLWRGTEDEMYRIGFAHSLSVFAGIPIREAVDLVHFSIQTTIKALKFSHFSPTCGGPIEVAVVTCDRPFRWVRHKKFDAAI